MKNFSLLFVFFLSTNLCLSQDGWSEWNTSSCYQGIDYRVKKGDYNEFTKGYKWIMQVKNRYKEAASISFNLSSANKQGSFTRQNAISGGTTQSWFLIKGVENASELIVGIKAVKFKSSNDFYDCDSQNMVAIEEKDDNETQNGLNKTKSSIYEKDDTDRVNDIMIEANDLLNKSLNISDNQTLLKTHRRILSLLEEAQKIDPSNEMLKITLKTQRDLVKSLESY